YVVYRNAPYSGQLAGGGVYIPGGIYTISNTLQLGYGEIVHSVHLYGDGRMYGEGGAFSGTLLQATFTDRPALAVNGGRRTTIRALSILGQNATWVDGHHLSYGSATLDDLVAANWVDPTCSCSRYAPYAGIAIDPYAGEVPATPYPRVTFPS